MSEQQGISAPELLQMQQKAVIELVTTEKKLQKDLSSEEQKFNSLKKANEKEHTDRLRNLKENGDKLNTYFSKINSITFGPLLSPEARHGITQNLPAPVMPDLNNLPVNPDRPNLPSLDNYIAYCNQIVQMGQQMDVLVSQIMTTRSEIARQQEELARKKNSGEVISYITVAIVVIAIIVLIAVIASQPH